MTDFSFLVMDASSGADPAFSWPPCYFAGPCDCSSIGGRGSIARSQPISGGHPGPTDSVAAVAQVSARELKKLMAAHVRFGHRNFRSIATALNMRMPAKVPFCRACVEAKATRHPKSRAPHPPRSVPPRAGYRIHFDPFGPFTDRLGDGSYYGILFADAYSSLLWFDTLPALGAWLSVLKALILKLETEKGSNHVVAELACNSAAMFKNNREFRVYGESRGIVLLFSPPYTQKFNAVVERPIRTVVEMAVAMSRRANTPRKFMHLAMRYAVRLLNRLQRKMPDGTVDVPLWRFKGSKVPLNLDRYHPFGCAVEAVIPKGQQRRFAPKTRRCIYFGYDDNALSYILGSLPGFSIFHTIHAYFNDDDFPCRASSTSWDDHPAYGMSAIDPLGPWLGSADVPVPRGHDPGEVQHDLPVAMGDVVVDETPPLPRLPESPIQGVAVQQSDPDPALPVVPLRRSQRGWHPSEAALQHCRSGTGFWACRNAR